MSKFNFSDRVTNLSIQSAQAQDKLFSGIQIVGLMFVSMFVTSWAMGLILAPWMLNWPYQLFSFLVYLGLSFHLSSKIIDGNKQDTVTDNQYIYLQLIGILNGWFIGPLLNLVWMLPQGPGILISAVLGITVCLLFAVIIALTCDKDKIHRALPERGMLINLLSGVIIASFLNMFFQWPLLSACITGASIFTFCNLLIFDVSLLTSKEVSTASACSLIFMDLVNLLPDFIQLGSALSSKESKHVDAAAFVGVMAVVCMPLVYFYYRDSAESNYRLGMS
ncbi:Bax inhibitor-1 family protein [Gammaproteobacteria bacterium]|nr:Bax inhibitor-1 family protein [Gammaproteobacteria bacterium]